ncbi:hypothetical protein [Streptomyces hydrogenans]|uniref:hypothetical protein n=1 Tax=Streptomyces hydrogenans TaxID=1873719 RepID=UPI003D75437C
MAHSIRLPRPRPGDLRAVFLGLVIGTALRALANFFDLDPWWVAGAFLATAGVPSWLGLTPPGFDPEPYSDPD